MAKTTKTAVRQTAAQKAAKAASARTAPAGEAGKSAPAVDTRTAAQLAEQQALGQTLADHSLSVHQAAAGAAQLATGQRGNTTLADATGERMSAIDAAVKARSDEARRIQDQNAKAAEGEEAMRVENQSVPLDSMGAAEAEMRVPAGVAKAAVTYEAQGISPDVTSPTTGPVVHVPGTGVAKLSELAPGQSLAPSPPISSSNILPQPDKPSFG